MMLFSWQQNKELLWLGEARPFSHEAAFWNATAAFKVGTEDWRESPNKEEGYWTHWYLQASHGPTQAMTVTGRTHYVCSEARMMLQLRTGQDMRSVTSDPALNTNPVGLHCLYNSFLINTQGRRQPPCWNMAYRKINGIYLFPSSQTLQIHLSFLIASVLSRFQNEGICKIGKGEGREHQLIGFSVTMVLKLRQCLPLQPFCLKTQLSVE